MFVSLRSDQLDDSHLSRVTATRTGTDDTAITAVLILILGSDIVDYLLSNSLLGDKGEYLALE